MTKTDWIVEFRWTLPKILAASDLGHSWQSPRISLPPFWGRSVNNYIYHNTSMSGRPGSRIGLRQARASCHNRIFISLSISGKKLVWTLIMTKQSAGDVPWRVVDQVLWDCRIFVLCWISISWMPSTLQHHKKPGKIKVFKNNKHDINTHAHE